MIYGYARVSTKLQASEGNSIESQHQMLTSAGATIIYTDTFTGTKMHRPELDKLLLVINPGDTIIITKLDRIARSTEEGLKVIQELLNKNVAIHVLNMGMIDNTTTGKLIITVLLAFAEFERNMICERTAEGRAIARLNPDYKEGRKKKYSRAQLEHALDLLNNYSYNQVVKMTGISKSTLIREKIK